MSAMTGPRSPPSPWPQESQNLPLASSSTPNPLFPICDSHAPSFSNISPRGPVPELSGPSYFSINVEPSGNRRKNQDSFPRVQSAISSPKSHLAHRRKTPDEQASTISAGPGNGDDLNQPPWNRKSELTEPAGGRRPKGAPAMVGDGSGHPISIECCAELLESSSPDLMLIDVRPYTHFTKGAIRGSLNLCIPTTLLKRPSYDTKKLANTFTNDSDKKNFARWKQCRYIIVYDASTTNMKDTASLLNVLKKFTGEGWSGEGLILVGGYNAFSSRFPNCIRREAGMSEVSSANPTPVSLSLSGFPPIAGGCALPDSSQASIPFFSNIRQHMDLVGGVGQIALQHSDTIPESQRRLLPSWLREASEPADKGRMVSQRFLELEKKEMERMQQALSYDKNCGSGPPGARLRKFRVAGIEKGAKNRYNDIYPYDHSRVKLQDVPPGACDYVNASYMKAEYSDNCYIATQAPVPDTFNDFWRVVWEQDVRLIVSLTAEVERGQIKCHRYWNSGNYGPCRVNNFSERRIPIDSPGLKQTRLESDKASFDKTDNSTDPSIIVRHFGLSHSDFPFQPLREVTQLQYPYWPDFGTTSQPAHLLKLIEQCDKVRSAGSTSTAGKFKEGSGIQRPVIVHCSAGCGRTGTFCTVDSVLDMLKQNHNLVSPQGSSSTDYLVQTGHLDLIAKTVGDFRLQRPSMVQNLSQFVLCYESVIEWVVSHTADVNRCC